MKPSTRPDPLFARPALGVPVTHGWLGGPALRDPLHVPVDLGSWEHAAQWLASAGPGHVAWKNIGGSGRVSVTFSRLASLRLQDKAGARMTEPTE